METRTVCQTRLYALLMNNVRDRAESRTAVAVSYEPDRLIQWMESMKVPQYRDDHDVVDSYDNSHGYWKSFAKGSPLEWYNPDYIISGQWFDQDCIGDVISHYLVV